MTVLLSSSETWSKAMDVRTAVEALIEQTVELIVGQVETATQAFEAAREEGAALRHREAARALFGARLDGALNAAASEVTRRAAQRFVTIRQHPRYSADAFVAELDDAEVLLNREIAAAQGRSLARPSLGLALALIRAQAISAAVGETPMSEAVTPRAKTGGPVQRRRPLTAADIPAPLAQVIFEAARSKDLAPAMTKLNQLERTPANVGAIVTKVRIALQRGGASRALTLAADLREAGVEEVIPPVDDEVLSKAGYLPATDVRTGPSVTIAREPAAVLKRDQARSDTYRTGRGGPRLTGLGG